LNWRHVEVTLVGNVLTLRQLTINASTDLTVAKDEDMRDCIQRVEALVKGVQSDGLSGLVQTVYRMIGENQPSAECIAQADADFASAADEEQVWGAALDMASCLMEAKLEVQPEEPEEPEPPEEPQTPTHPPKVGGTAAGFVLAALLVHLHHQKNTPRFDDGHDTLG
jgi:tetrahydromethanopterin S-methyltransferase subunit F